MFSRFGDLQNLPFFEPDAIFKTKVVKYWTAPKIDTMRAKVPMARYYVPKKETFASGRAHMKNKPMTKKLGKMPAAILGTFGVLKNWFSDDRAQIRQKCVLVDSA